MKNRGGGAALGDGWRAITGRDGQQPASKPGSCVMPSQLVRDLTDPKVAARKLIEIANSVKAVQGRIHSKKIDWPFPIS